MTLQIKTIITVAITLFVALLAMMAISDRVVMAGFMDLERKMAVESAQRARAALDDDVEQVRVKVTDWSSWDDMCRFVGDRNENFIRSNLLVESLARMDLAAVLVIGNAGNTVWNGMVNDAGDEFRETPNELEAVVRRIAAKGRGGSSSGILRLSGRVYLLVIEPILNSKGAGETHGTVAFLRAISTQTIARINTLGNLDASISGVGDPGMQPETLAAQSALLGGAPWVVGHAVSGKVSAYLLLKDAEGTPALVLRTDTARVVYQAGLLSTREGFAMVTVLGLMFGVSMVGVVSRLVIRRVVRLRDDVTAIAWTRQFSERVGEQGGDEIASLSGAIDGLLSEIESARAQTESANVAKSQFLARMSHEIRTPLTSILGYADLLEDASVSEPDRAEHVRTIRASGRHLLGVINDVLDLSKIEVGKMTVERIDFTPTQVLIDVLRMMSARATAKGLTLAVEFDSPIPTSARSDPMRLQQILVNLIGNALKFCETGSVRVGVRVERASEPEAMLVFEVRDTGIGMSNLQLSELFKPFAQADVSTARRFGGTGLGLTISWNLAKLLGGEISAQSQPGKGSTFTAKVQAGSITGVPMIDRFDQHAPAAIVPGSNIMVRLLGRVLLAEDNVASQRLIAFHLERAGAKVVLAENGQVALDLVRAADAKGTPFNLLLMDMEMPVLDGYEAVRLLRESGCSIPVVALTAHAMADARSKCVAAGCDDFATKPIDRDALVQTCASWIAKAVSKSTSIKREERATDGTRTRDLKDHNLVL